MTAPDHKLYRGHDGETEFLLTVWDDGDIDIATRPLSTSHVWSPPARLRPVPVAVTK